MTGMENPADKTTIGQIFTQNSLIIPEKPALVWKDQRSISYGTITDISEQVAKSLIGLGIDPGRFIAIWALNEAKWLYSMGGSSMAGYPFIGLNTAYKAPELRQVLAHSGASVLFIGDDKTGTTSFASNIAELCPEIYTDPPGTWRSAVFPDLQYVVSFGSTDIPGILSWDEFIKKGISIDDDMLIRQASAVQPDDLALIMYTSGTTGFPKGVMHTHKNLIASADIVSSRIRLTDTDVACIPVPFFHILGITMAVASLWTQGQIAIIDRFSAKDTLQTIEECRATALYGIVSMFAFALETQKAENFDLKSLRTGIIAGSLCPPDLVTKVIEEMGISEFVIGYGSTEAICLIASLPDDPVAKRSDSLGTPLPGVEIRIVDGKDGTMVQQGEIGEALARSPWCMKGYYQMPEKTSEALDSLGFYHTHDMMYEDSDGYFHFVGRIDDLIIRGGENIFPKEIEQELHTHPDVRDCAVIGIPCEYYGEEIVAFIILKEEAKVIALELKRYCSNTMAIHKVPSLIIIVDSFPLSGTGKVQVSKLREIAFAYQENR